MGKQLDPAIAEILKGFGFGRDAVWDCHGVIVVYHRIIEQIAAKAGIRFDAPIVLEANGPAKAAALCVTGYLGDKSEWSIGEASPANNKNAYPFAMAEKRAKDRVVLKLVGLHGLAYSEEEADDFKGSEPKAEPRRAPGKSDLCQDMIERLSGVQTMAQLRTMATGEEWTADIAKLSEADAAEVRKAYGQAQREIGQNAVAGTP